MLLETMIQSSHVVQSVCADRTEIPFSQYLGVRSWLCVVESNIYESGYLEELTLSEMLPQGTLANQSAISSKV